MLRQPYVPLAGELQDYTYLNLSWIYTAYHFLTGVYIILHAIWTCKIFTEI